MKKSAVTSIALDRFGFIFKHPRIRSFLQGMSIIFIFNLTAYILRFIVTIFVARSWGPVEYGKISLILSLGAFLFFPVIMGQHNAMFKYLPNSDETRHRGLIFTVLVSNGMIAAGVVVVYFLIYPLIIRPLKIDLPIWRLAILMAVANNYQALTESFLRGKKLFKPIGILKIVNALVFLIVVTGVLVTGVKESAWFIGAFAAGMAVFSVITLGYLKIKPVIPDSGFGKKSLHYGFFVMINQLVTSLIFNGDLVIMNYFLSGKDLGFYVAYQGLIKALFFLFFEEIFAVVFLPNIAKMNRKKLFRTLSKFDLLIVAAIAVLAGLALAIILALYGNKYVFNIMYLLISASGIGFFAMFQIYNHVLTMEGKTGAKRAFTGVLLIIPFFLVLLSVLTSRFGLSGAVISISTVFFLLYVVFKIMLGRWFAKKEEGDRA